MVYYDITPGETAAAGAVFSVLGIALSSTRLFIRHTALGRWNADDWLVIPAMVLSDERATW